ncbi:MAG: SiaB family protein kinase [Bacteroidota bacterium]
MAKKFSFFHHYLNLNNHDIIVSYKGPMSDVIIHEISKDIQNKVIEDPKAGKKVYSIFMELAQNIFFYSGEVTQFGDKAYRIGSIVLSQDEGNYTLTAGNIVDKKWVPVLWDRCELINSLDRAALRKLKFEARDDNDKSENSKGAGIGLIQVALTSAQPISVEFRDIDDQTSFFALSVNIVKQKQ